MQEKVKEKKTVGRDVHHLWSVTAEEACIRDVQPEVSRIGCEKQEIPVHNRLRLRLVYEALGY
jgi:hypothetical protein